MLCSMVPVNYVSIHFPGENPHGYITRHSCYTIHITKHIKMWSVLCSYGNNFLPPPIHHNQQWVETEVCSNNSLSALLLGSYNTIDFMIVNDDRWMPITINGDQRTSMMINDNSWLDDMPDTPELSSLTTVTSLQVLPSVHWAHYSNDVLLSTIQLPVVASYCNLNSFSLLCWMHITHIHNESK